MASMIIDASNVPDWARRSLRLLIALTVFGLAGHGIIHIPFLEAEYVGEFQRSCTWAGITAIVVNAPLIGRVVATSTERTLGTLLGGIGGFIAYDYGTRIFSTQRGDELYLVFAASLVGAISCYLAFALSLDMTPRFFAMTFLLVTMGAPGYKSAATVAFLRTMGILTGVIIMQVLAIFVLPKSASVEAIRDVQKALKKTCELSDLVWSTNDLTCPSQLESKLPGHGAEITAPAQKKPVQQKPVGGEGYAGAFVGQLIPDKPDAKQKREKDPELGHAETDLPLHAVDLPPEASPSQIKKGLGGLFGWLIHKQKVHTTKKIKASNSQESIDNLHQPLLSSHNSGHIEPSVPSMTSVADAPAGTGVMSDITDSNSNHTAAGAAVSTATMAGVATQAPTVHSVGNHNVPSTKSVASFEMKKRAQDCEKALAGIYTSLSACEDNLKLSAGEIYLWHFWGHYLFMPGIPNLGRLYTRNLDKGGRGGRWHLQSTLVGNVLTSIRRLSRLLWNAHLSLAEEFTPDLKEAVEGIYPSGLLPKLASAFGDALRKLPAAFPSSSNGLDMQALKELAEALNILQETSDAQHRLLVNRLTQNTQGRFLAARSMKRSSQKIHGLDRLPSVLAARTALPALPTFSFSANQRPSTPASNPAGSYSENGTASFQAPTPPIPEVSEGSTIRGSGLWTIGGWDQQGLVKGRAPSGVIPENPGRLSRRTTDNDSSYIAPDQSIQQGESQQGPGQVNPTNESPVGSPSRSLESSPALSTYGSSYPPATRASLPPRGPVRHTAFEDSPLSSARPSTDQPYPSTAATGTPVPHVGIDVTRGASEDVLQPLPPGRGYSDKPATLASRILRSVEEESNTAQASAFSQDKSATERDVTAADTTSGQFANTESKVQNEGGGILAAPTTVGRFVDTTHQGQALNTPVGTSVLSAPYRQPSASSAGGIGRSRSSQLGRMPWETIPERNDSGVTAGSGGELSVIPHTSAAGLMFSATPEGHIAQVRWASFEWLMDQLCDELEELYAAVAAFMATLPHPL